MSAIRIGVSACLLGREVRYDGGHKKDDFILRALGPLVEFVPVCPELELGLGVPREPIQLERDSEGLRLVSVKTRRDLTRRMSRFARQRIAALAGQGLCGFILKKDSPSCGLARVKVHSPGGWDRSGQGLFARALKEAFPRMPLADEHRLQDPRRLAVFLKRALAYQRSKDLPPE